MAVGATRLRVSVARLNPSVCEGSDGRLQQFDGQGNIPHRLGFLGIPNHAGIFADFDVIDDSRRGGGGALRAEAKGRPESQNLIARTTGAAENYPGKPGAISQCARWLPAFLT